MSVHYGVKDDEPYTETIRTHPSIDTVVTTDRGVQITALLSDPDVETPAHRL